MAADSIAQGLRLLPPMWETRLDFLDPGFGLVQHLTVAVIRRISQQMEELSVCLCLSLCATLCLRERKEEKWVFSFLDFFFLRCLER